MDLGAEVKNVHLTIKMRSIKVVILILFLTSFLSPGISMAWTSPVLLSTESLNTNAGNPIIRLDPSGVPHVIWRDNRGLLYVNKSPNGDWSSPVNVIESPEAYPPSMAIDSSGVLHVVWQDSNGIFYIKKAPAGDWSSPVNISDISGTASPDIAADTSRVIHVVWSASSGILYANKTLDGDWSSPVNISSTSGVSSPAIAVDNSGVLHVVWSEKDSILYSHKNPDGGWVSPANISNLPGKSINPDIAIDTRGTIYIVWGYYHVPFNAIYSSNKSSGDSWSTPIRLYYSTLGGGIFDNWNPAIFVDRNNTIHGIWGAFNGREVRYFFRAAGTDNWAITLIRGEDRSYSADIVADSSGIIHLVWQKVGTGGLFDILYSNNSDRPNNPPKTPNNPSPSDGATGVSVSPTFSWSGGDPDTDDPVTYDFYLGITNSDPSSLQLKKSGLTTNNYIYDTQSYGTLRYSTTYYWQIVATDSRQTSVYSPIWSFTTEQAPNDSPYIPSNPSPADDATGQAINTTLGWQGGDPDQGDTVIYNIYFGTSNNPPLIKTGHDTNSYNPGALNYSTTYYWQIVAKDNHEATTTGPIWSFTTGSITNNAPNAPSNPSPSDGAPGVSIEPTLSWSGGDPDGGDTVTYDTYFGTSNNPPNIARGLSSASYSPSRLSYATTYYWRVVARDNHGAEASGSVWRFTTLPPPNQTPIAKAGPDQVVPIGSKVILDGSGSSDPDGDSLSYSWTLVSKPIGSDVALSANSSPSISFTPDKDGLYKLQLVVSDGQTQSNPDYLTVRALGQENKIIVATNKTQYKPGDTLELYIWVGNAATGSGLSSDAFLGFGLPDGSLYFFDPNLNLKPSNPTDPRSFIPFAQNVTLSSGFVFPTSAEMNADSDDNGKLDTYRLFSVTLPQNLSAGEYFAFAALAAPSSTQSGFPQLLSPINLAYFDFSH